MNGISITVPTSEVCRDPMILAMPRLSQTCSAFGAPQGQQQLQQAYGKLKALEQRKPNTDISGRSELPCDLFESTDLQVSGDPFLNTYLRGINNVTGAISSVANGLTNGTCGVAYGAGLATSAIEDKIVEHGGPNFESLMISAQAISPTVPLDDAFFYGASRLASLGRSLGALPKTEGMLAAASAESPALAKLSKAAELGVKGLSQEGALLEKGASQLSKTLELEKLLSPQLADKVLKGPVSISAEVAEQVMVKKGFSPTQTRAFLNSMEGTMQVRIAKPGESFVRYTDLPKSTGNFLTKASFSTSEKAIKGLHLESYGNRASFQQVVRAKEASIVIEGEIKNGALGIKQSIILDKSSFEFSVGKELHRVK